jgi:hypothetical protein
MARITEPGTYNIIPITCTNKIGNPYQLREAVVEVVDADRHQIFIKDTGWIDWDLPLVGEKIKK